MYLVFCNAIDPPPICWKEECMRELKKQKDEKLRALENEEIERERRAKLREQMEKEGSGEIYTTDSPNFILYDVNVNRKRAISVTELYKATIV